MKTRCSWLLIIPLLISSVNFLPAQKSGIYLTATDFDNGKISFVKKENLKYKFRLNDVFNTKTIKITIGDSTHSFYKDSIFGYRDSENTNHRFYNKKTYQIINPFETILLYTTTTLVNRKESQPITDYFFSANSGTAIYPLTKLNLKKAFPNDSHFHELIDMYFDKDNKLLTYDSFYHQYKINRIYHINQTQK